MSQSPTILQTLRDLVADAPQPVYLVGGAVRDLLIGRPLHDVDLAVADGAVSLAFQLGDRLGAPAFVLDRERDIGRIVLDALTIDVARFRGRAGDDDLLSDLRARDFTLNAMAVPLAAVDTPSFLQAIVDPCAGRDDIARQRVQPCYPGSVADDPVRALRAVRMGVTFGFALAADTQRQARAARLARVSAERIRDELLKLLLTDRPDIALEQLHQLGLLLQTLPEIAALDGQVIDGADRLAATAARLRRVAALPDRLGPVDATAVGGYLDRAVTGNLDGHTLLRLAALFFNLSHVVGEKGAARSIGRRLRALRLSNEAVQHVVQAVTRAGALARVNLMTGDTRRAIHRFYRETGRAGVDICLLALADGAEEPASTLLDAYFHAYDRVVRPTPLLDGRALMAAFDLPPGRHIGVLLTRLQEEQAAGAITTVDEARAVLAAWVAEMDRGTPPDQ